MSKSKLENSWFSEPTHLTFSILTGKDTSLQLKHALYINLFIKKIQYTMPALFVKNIFSGQNRGSGRNLFFAVY